MATITLNEQVINDFAEAIKKSIINIFNDTNFINNNDDAKLDIINKKLYINNYNNIDKNESLKNDNTEDDMNKNYTDNKPLKNTKEKNNIEQYNNSSKNDDFINEEVTIDDKIIKDDFIEEETFIKNDSIKDDIDNNDITNDSIKDDSDIIEDNDVINNGINNLNDIIEMLKTNKNVAIPWWQIYNKKFKSGDIIYIRHLNKFGIFINPSKKENKIKARLIKQNNKHSLYTQDWIFNIDEIELVKHKNKLNKKFIEDDNTFKLK